MTDIDPRLWNTGNTSRYVFNIRWVARRDGANIRIQSARTMSAYGRKPKGDVWNISSWAQEAPAAQGWERNFALASDPVQAPGPFNAANVGAAWHAAKNGRAYNLLFKDGSVQTAIVPNDVFRPMNISSPAGMLDTVGVAESVAAGQPPRPWSSVYTQVVIGN